MKIVVPINLILDLVEEINIDESGSSLDLNWARLIINEFDDHAIEEAILLKEKVGGEVIVLGLDSQDIDNVLFSAAAKGADRLVKLTGDFNPELNNHEKARLFVPVLKNMQPDLVMTGIQSHSDLDGQIAPLMAEYLGFPYIGYVAGVSLENKKAIVRKEYPGGLIAEMEIGLPAVLGIQASEEPPRYVAFSKVRQAMKDATIEELSAGDIDSRGGPEISKMFLPDVAERATMIEGNADEVARKLLEIFKEQGITK